MKRKYTIGFLVVLLLTAGAASLGAFNTPRNAGAEPISVATVLDRARSMAKENGDTRPTLAKYVLTTRQAAESSDSSCGVDSNPSVFYVVMRGNFTDTHASIPSGANVQPPSGNQLEFTVDAATGTILDFGIVHRPAAPILASLGAEHDITALVQQPW